MVDPKSILFTTSTLNDALPAYQVDQTPCQKLLQLHEDDWRQFEAISATYTTAIDQELMGIRKIHETASVRTKMGDRDITVFRSVHIRKLIRSPVSPCLELAEFAALADNRDRFAGFSLSGSPPAVGGYAFQMAGLVIYGQADGDRVLSICFSYSEAPRLTPEKAEQLAALLEKNHLIVVHWPSATKLDVKTQFVGFLTRTE
jgi:hypothetical protein